MCKNCKKASLETNLTTSFHATVTQGSLSLSCRYITRREDAQNTDKCFRTIA